MTLLAGIAFAVIGILLLYCLIGDSLGIVDLDKVFGTRRALLFALFPLAMIEFALWDYLFA